MRALKPATMMGAGLCLFAVCTFGRLVNDQNAHSLDKGAVVESLAPNFEADKAGIRQGDIFLEWSRENRHGVIDSPFDLNYLRLEEAPHGPVTLVGLRDGKKQSWRLGDNYWAMDARPNFQGRLLSIYQREKSLAEKGQLKQAVDDWERVTDLEEKSSSPWLGAWVLLRLAELADGQQSEMKDSDVFLRAAQQADAASPIVKAEVLKRLAYSYRVQDDLIEAEKSYEEAIAEYRKLGARSMVLASALRDIGSFAYLQGNFTEAEGYLRESAGITKALAPNSVQALWNIITMGALFQERGDFANAEAYYRRALRIEEASFPSSADFALTLQNLGMLSARRGDKSKAEGYYKRALLVAEKSGSTSQYLPDILSNLAECVLDRGDPAAAERYERRSLAIREKLPYGQLSVASSLRNLGKIARIKGNLDKAEEYYKKSLAIAEKMKPVPPAAARFLIGLGYVARDRGDFTAAETYFRRALTILETVAPDGADHAETLADLAGALRAERQFDAAAKTYEQALTEFQDEATHLGGGDDDRSHYRALHDRYYREYVDVLMSLGKPELAFQALEGARARTLLEVLLRADIDVRKGVDASLLERAKDLQAQRNARSAYRLRLLERTHTAEQVAAVDHEISELLDQYQQVDTEIRAKSPAYEALVQSQPLDSAEIRQLLDPDTLLLEYSLGEQRSYVWAVSRDSLTVYELPKRAEIDALAKSVYQFLAAPASAEGHTESQATHIAKVNWEYEKAAAKLSHIVLGPVAGLLQDKRLLIVSDGALQYISFGALPAPDTSATGTEKQTLSSGSTKHRSTPPLIVEHEIINLPSASILAELRRQAQGRAAPAKFVAVFADPVFTADDERVTGLISRGVHGAGKAHISNAANVEPSATQLTRSIAEVTGKNKLHLTRLLYTRREAEAILSLMPPNQGMKAIDFRASRATAMSAELAQYRVIHFATHGLLNNDHPELSGLVLSLVDKQGHPQDGFLELADIYTLHLPVDLVVLSTCDAALGLEMNGEGLIGLTRGFMYAGATRVVASLWSVNDAATSELMTQFYRAMQQDKMKPAAALRAAQINLWKQKIWRSPYFWAGFEIQGDWR